MDAGSFVELKVSDGTTMSAFVARPHGGGRRPGIMIFQEAFGVNAHIRDVAGRFARQGYVAIAPELFHRSGQHVEVPYGNFETARPYITALKDELLTADVQAAFDWLRSDAGTDPQRIASVGFCMGGRVSFLANAVVPLRAAASFYGGGIAQGYLNRAPQMHAPMLLVWGGLDKHISPEQANAVAAALRTAGKTFVNAEFSNADHAFFCDARPSYNKAAAAQAWALLLEFLNNSLEQR